MTKKLSRKAIQDLRLTLHNIYGPLVHEKLTNKDLNHIGNILMTLYLSELEHQIEAEELRLSKTTPD